MKCDFCTSKATVFLTQLVEGKMQKVCLCEACATEKGVTDPTGFSLADMLFSNAASGSEPTGSKKSLLAQDSAKVCHSCGFTLEDLKRVRRFGCSECYTTFTEEVMFMIRGMHKGLQHIGKVPVGLMEKQFYHERVEQLRSRLDQAIISESYEEAAGIRDELRNLEQENALKI